MFRINFLRRLKQQYLSECVLFQSRNVEINSLPFYNYMSNAKTVENVTNDSDITLNNNRSMVSSNKFLKTNKNSDEKDFLLKIKYDPDKFGTGIVDELTDEGDIKEEKYFTEQPTPAQKLRTKQYAEMIKDLINKRKIKEAIDVLEVRMLQEDKVKPEGYIYNLLLGACGRVGYTKKAFMLYNNMKKRGIEATGGTYTALFNACANSPWPEDGLSRAKHLYDLMQLKQYEPNDTNYNCMIKAFGRCGDLPTAFNLADEMVSKGFKLKDDTINFLLQSCISDKEAGFRHALLVWRKVVNKKIQPSIYTYNLMLKCIKDCGIGDLEVTKDVLKKILPKKALRIESGGSTCSNKLIEESGENLENNLVVETSDSSLDLRPNLMADVPHLGSMVSLNEVTKAEDRLLLVGGLSGFLENMSEHNCTPNVKTFTQLLEVIPGSLAAEKELILAMRKLNVRPDLDFYNVLIKKRSMRFDYESAKDVLNNIKSAGYRPDLITFGVLALGCKTREEGLELIEKMKKKKYRMNIQILGAMLRQACVHTNFKYVLEIMETVLREDLKVNKIFTETLEEFRKKCKDISNDKSNPKSNKVSFQNGHKLFRMRYKTWKDEVQLDESEDAHPWQQFRQTNETDGSKLKNKEIRFKARHASLFKVKTSPKHLQSSKNKK